MRANPYDVAASVAIPYLMVESICYRFGLRDNATQSVGLRGDALFYAHGSAYQQKVAGNNTAAQSFALTQPALPYRGDEVNGTKCALGVMLASGRRLSVGTDYTAIVADHRGRTAECITAREPQPRHRDAQQAPRQDSVDGHR